MSNVLTQVVAVPCAVVEWQSVQAASTAQVLCAMRIPSRVTTLAETALWHFTHRESGTAARSALSPPATGTIIPNSSR